MEGRKSPDLRWLLGKDEEGDIDEAGELVNLKI
jgi:hypothetical protein